MLGCTIGAVRLKGELYFFKNHDIGNQKEREKYKPVLLPDKKQELEQQKINFPSKWPEKDYVAIGIPMDSGKYGWWVFFGGGMSKNIGFGAAGSHTIDRPEQNWNQKEYDLHNNLRQGSLEWGSPNSVEGGCKDTAKEIDLYTNYLYCFKDNAVVVEIKAKEMYTERLVNKPFLLRTNHYNHLGNEKPENDAVFRETLGRYRYAEKRLPTIQSVDDIIDMLCTSPLNRYTGASYVGCVRTGEFWYCLKNPEAPSDFKKMVLKKA